MFGSKDYASFSWHTTGSIFPSLSSKDMPHFQNKKITEIRYQSSSCNQQFYLGRCSPLPLQRTSVPAHPVAWKIWKVSPEHYHSLPCGFETLKHRGVFVLTTIEPRGHLYWRLFYKQIVLLRYDNSQFSKHSGLSTLIMDDKWSFFPLPNQFRPHLQRGRVASRLNEAWDRDSIHDLQGKEDGEQLINSQLDTTWQDQ